MVRPLFNDFDDLQRQTDVTAPAESKGLSGTLATRAVPPLEEFDWSTDESVIISDQPATAVYANRHGQLVIRQQRACDQDEDTFVVIDRAHLPHFMMMLKLELEG